MKSTFATLAIVGVVVGQKIADTAWTGIKWDNLADSVAVDGNYWHQVNADGSNDFYMTVKVSGPVQPEGTVLNGWLCFTNPTAETLYQTVGYKIKSAYLDNVMPAEKSMGTFYGTQKFKTAMTDAELSAMKAQDTLATTPWKDDGGARWKQYYSAASGRQAVMAVFRRNFVDAKTFNIKLGDTIKFQAGFFIGNSPVATSYENQSGVLSLTLLEGAVTKDLEAPSTTTTTGTTTTTTGTTTTTTGTTTGTKTTTASAFTLSASLTFATTAAMLLM